MIKQKPSVFVALRFATKTLNEIKKILLEHKKELKEKYKVKKIGIFGSYTTIKIIIKFEGNNGFNLLIRSRH